MAVAAGQCRYSYLLINATIDSISIQGVFANCVLYLQTQSA